jgi:hypothetical protein
MGKKKARADFADLPDYDEEPTAAPAPTQTEDGDVGAQSGGGKGQQAKKPQPVKGKKAGGKKGKAAAFDSDEEVSGSALVVLCPAPCPGCDVFC